jgi:hypothetical protein
MVNWASLPLARCSAVIFVKKGHSAAHLDGNMVGDMPSACGRR